MKRNRNPRYLKQYRDGAGNWINQYRRDGKLMRLPNGRDFSDAWWEAYYEAERRVLAGEVREVGQTRTRPNSIDAALVGFYKSTGFRNYALGSQRTICQSLERDFRPIIGSAPLRHLRPKHILDLLAELTLPSGRLLLTALRAFLCYCVEIELIDRDPTAGIKLPKVKTDGFHTWFEEEIAQYRNAHPVDTTARIALELHLNTIQRTSDVIRMGWQHVREGMIHITQEKTGAPVSIPILPELQTILDQLPRSNLTFLVNGRGSPFAHGYNRNWRKWIGEAGLDLRCVPHGLRKAGMDRFAAAGWTVHEIAAWSGHQTLAEVERYTKKYDRLAAARRGAAKIIAKTGT